MRISFLVCLSSALLALTMVNPVLVARQATDQDPASTPPDSTEEAVTDAKENPAEDKPRKQVVKDPRLSITRLWGRVHASCCVSGTIAMTSRIPG